MFLRIRYHNNFRSNLTNVISTKEQINSFVSPVKPDNLAKLNDAGFIYDEVLEKSSMLRSMVMDLQGTDKWNVEGVRNSPEWRKILELSDEIKKIIE